MHRIPAALASALFVVVASLAWADEYTDTINVYKNAGESAEFFKNSYGYAVFPSIAKGSLGIGAGTRRRESERVTKSAQVHDQRSTLPIAVVDN